MKRYVKVGLIVAGHVLALLCAIGAVAIREAMVSEPGSDGMQAFGDSLLFLAVFGLAAVPATAGALVLLRSSRWFWRLLAITAAAIAVSGVAAAVVYLGAQGASGNAFLDKWSSLAVLRIIVAPLFALAFFLSGVFAPARTDRIALLAASAVEAAVFVCILITWFNPI